MYIYMSHTADMDELDAKIRELQVKRDRLNKERQLSELVCRVR